MLVWSDGIEQYARSVFQNRRFVKYISQRYISKPNQLRVPYSSHVLLRFAWTSKRVNYAFTRKQTQLTSNSGTCLAPHQGKLRHTRRSGYEQTTNTHALRGNACPAH